MSDINHRGSLIILHANMSHVSLQPGAADTKVQDAAQATAGKAVLLTSWLVLHVFACTTHSTAVFRCEIH